MKIKYLGTIIKGRTPPTGAQEYWNGDVPFVTTKDLQSGKYIRSTERYISQKGLQLYPKHIIPPNTVCISCTGNLGYVGITTKPCITNQQIHAIIPDKNNDPEYIYYLMKSMWGFFKQIEGHSTVTSQISKEKFSEIEIAVPDLNKQREIVSVLSSFDAFLEINARKEVNLRDQLRLIYDYFTSDIKASISIKDLCAVKMGIHNIDPSAETNFGGNIKLLRTQDISGTFVSDTGVTVTEKAVTDLNRNNTTFPSDSIVLSIVGTIGQAAIITEPMYINGAIAVIKPIDGEMTEYIYLYLLCKSEYLKTISVGSVLKRINIETLKSLSVPIGSDEEMRHIIDIIHPYFEQLRHIHEENRIITRSRDIAIKKMFENTSVSPFLSTRPRAAASVMPNLTIFGCEG